MNGWLLRNRIAAEKRWPQEQKSVRNGCEARPRGVNPIKRTQKLGAGKKYEKNLDVLHSGRAQAVTVDIPTLDRL